jgi:hypothetical protein
MNLLRFPLAKLSLGVASLALLTGCQSTVYRAVSDVAVSRPGDVGSSGPLVLVAGKPGEVKAVAQADLAGVYDRMSLNQIGILDPTMGGYLRAQRDAESKLTDLKAASNPDPEAIKAAQAKAAAAKKQVDDYAREWRDMQRKLSAANNPQGGSVATPSGELTHQNATPAVAPTQTVLMASEHHSLGFYASHLNQTMVLIIDGPPRPGEYWLTPDNSELIVSSAYSAPARSRVNLVGSVKILKVDGNRILADVAIRKTTEADSGEMMERLYDPAVYWNPWLILGRHTFEVTSPGDPAFEKAQVHWVTE